MCVEIFDRRGLLAALSATTMFAALATPLTAMGRTSPKLALCDISVRNALRADYAGALKKVAAIGFSHFSYRLEAYMPTDTPDPLPRDKARMVADAGLQPGVVRFLNPANLDRYIADTNLVGSKVLALTLGDIFVPHPDKSPLTIAQVEDFARRLDGWGARARAAGVTLAYHNHAVDGIPIDGIRPFDRILELTDPRHVAVELDFGWAFAAGYDILTTVRRLGPRLVSMHWKDVIGEPYSDWTTLRPVEIGAGSIGLASLLPKVAAATRALPGLEIEGSADEFGSAQRGYDFAINNLRQG